MSLSQVAKERISDLCENFEFYLKSFESEASAHLSEGTAAVFRHEGHIRTTRMRGVLGSVRELVASDEFIESVWKTLDDWGMNKRRAKIIPIQEFKSQLRESLELIVQWEKWSIADLNDPKRATLLRITLLYLMLSAGKSQVVAGSKALHHFLHNLLPPIDRRYTCTFFDVSGPDGPIQFRTIVEGFARIAQCIEEQHGKNYLSGLVGKTPWSTSETKLIDNAVVGYVKKHNL